MSTFEIITEDHTYRRPEATELEAARARLDALLSPENLHDPKTAAKHYKASKALITAINTALTVAAPLLLTGVPGTGKTQVAYYLSWYFDLPLFTYQVRSVSTVDDMKYDFDTVGYLHYAQHDDNPAEPKTRADFLTRNALWQAFECTKRSVLLIDEIDKAPRDFPNDLLQELDQYCFKHPFENRMIPEQNPLHRPIVIITSNAERRLPDAFLRRCVFHHIELTPELLRNAVAARAGDFPDLPEDVRAQAIRCFQALLRHPSLQRKPATAELLVWLAVLSARRIDLDQLDDKELDRLPGLEVLIKDKDDWDRLHGHS